MAEIVPHPCLAVAKATDPVRHFIHKLENAVSNINDIRGRIPNERAEVLVLVYSWAATEIRTTKTLDDPLIRAILRLIQTLADGTRDDVAL